MTISTSAMTHLIIPSHGSHFTIRLCDFTRVPGQPEILLEDWIVQGAPGEGVCKDCMFAYSEDMFSDEDTL